MPGIGLVADVALRPTVGVTPLLGSHPEESHVQNVGFAGVDKIDLGARQLRRNQVGLDGVGMNPVVDLREVALDVPAKLLELLLLQPLELLDEIQLELDRNPRGKFKGDILVGECAAIAARF